MSTIKDQRFEEILRVLAAKFITLESNYTSLITVTRVDTVDFGSIATVYFTVLPEERETAVLDFLKRKRSDFREYVKDNARLMRIPFFDFQIDKGEKARQKIDAVTLQP